MGHPSSPRDKQLPRLPALPACASSLRRRVAIPPVEELDPRAGVILVAPALSGSRRAPRKSRQRLSPGGHIRACVGCGVVILRRLSGVIPNGDRGSRRHIRGSAVKSGRSIRWAGDPSSPRLATSVLRSPGLCRSRPRCNRAGRSRRCKQSAGLPTESTDLGADVLLVAACSSTVPPASAQCLADRPHGLRLLRAGHDAHKRNG